MQGTSYPTYNLFMPNLKGILNKLESNTVKKYDGNSVNINSLTSDVQVEALKARKKLLADLYVRFDTNLEQQWREDLYVATLLDPRMKHFNAWPTKQIFYDLDWAKKVLIFHYFLFICLLW